MSSLASASALAFAFAACTPRQSAPVYDEGPRMEERVALFPYYVVADPKGTVRWGYLDAAGLPRIEPRYAEARPFGDGLAPVRLEPGGPWGFVNLDGDLSIQPQYEEVRPFSQGRAAVKAYGSWDWIDERGKKVSELRLPGVAPLGDFAEGLAVVDVGGKKGYAGLDGKIAIQPRFADAAPFSEGLAQVVPEGSERAGFIDKTGTIVIDPRFTFTGARFSDELAAVEETGQVLFIDPTGKPAFEARFEDARPFSESLAAAKQNMRWGFIDHGGSWVLEPRWDDAQSFSEGLAVVLVAGKRGYADRKGELVIPARFDKAGPFQDGIASVEIEGKPSLIDRTGAALWRAP